MKSSPKQRLRDPRVASIYGALGATAVSAWFFAALAGRVLQGQAPAFDQAILLALRNPTDLRLPSGPPWLPEAARDVTALGGVTVLTLAVLAALGYLLLLRRYWTSLFILVATVGGSAISFTLKDWYHRPRPSLVPHLTPVLTSSFPSAHAMLSAVVYLTFGGLLAQLATRRRLKLYVLGVAVALTLLVGATRVYLGVHYPSDVLAGWSAGLAWASLSALAARLLRRRSPTLRHEAQSQTAGEV
ncbi:MAG TPA: phosphatase PAP2 family protein [Myxococcaceae bacterium]|nr:phosphatase PAP2 family protein [Myxococcaceae bacterium]